MFVKNVVITNHESIFFTVHRALTFPVCHVFVTKPDINQTEVTLTKCYQCMSNRWRYISF